MERTIVIYEPGSVKFCQGFINLLLRSFYLPKRISCVSIDKLQTWQRPITEG